MKWRFIYRGLKARFRDQRQEILTLVQALKPDDIAVDVGSNKGSYLWSLSRAVPSGLVIAFEPQTILATYITKACQIAGFANVVIVGKGVSNRIGISRLAIPGGGATSPGASFEEAVRAEDACQFVDVETTTLDEFFALEKRHIGAIKIDVEGHELSVLEGAKEVLINHRPVVVCETEQRHLSKGKVSDIFYFMNQNGYDGHFFHNGKLFPISEFKPEIHQSEVGDKFWNSNQYCNNFIFTPRVAPIHRTLWPS